MSSDHQSPTRTSSTHLLPVLSGHRAVDCLGVEIYICRWRYLWNRFMHPLVTHSKFYNQGRRELITTTVHLG